VISERKCIYIVVKTYPTISKEYSELVCTAGIQEDGSWIRLYPVPFRKLEIEQKYPKYAWIEVDVVRNLKDFRPETYRPDLSTIRIEPRSKKIDWDERRKIILGKSRVYTNLQELIDKAKVDSTSLAIFKPSQIVDFIVEDAEREWDSNRLKCLQELSQQQNLFQTPEEIEEEFKVVQKIPYKFSYRLIDDSGKTAKMMIEDWEIGMLYLNCLWRANGNEADAISKVKEKYYMEFLKRDLYLFLGTTLRFHNVAPNPFVIVGVFQPPFESANAQLNLFNL
jgi:hypothetical protein